MNKCRQINFKIHFCEKLYDYVKETHIKTDRLEYCPFCREPMKVFNNGDPWLYDEAIVSRWLPGRLDREIVRYKGQSLEGYEYYVHGTPWEYIPIDVDEIEILATDIICYFDKNINNYKYTVWITMPKSLLPDNFDPVKYQRPEWTKYLPGV